MQFKYARNSVKGVETEYDGEQSAIWVIWRLFKWCHVDNWAFALFFIKQWFINGNGNVKFIIIGNEIMFPVTLASSAAGLTALHARWNSSAAHSQNKTRSVMFRTIRCNGSPLASCDLRTCQCCPPTPVFGQAKESSQVERASQLRTDVRGRDFFFNPVRSLCYTDARNVAITLMTK